MGASIEIRNVSKSFRVDEKELLVFGPVSLKIESGQFFSILGPSGCGKSTLMLMIAGLLDATQGEIFLNENKVDSPQTDIGIMFQENTLVPWRVVRKNIELQLEMRGMDPNLHKDRVTELIRSVKLEDFANRYPNELSGGMQQRAAFCQALVHEPETLLLDEPLGKLDAMTREGMRNDLQEVWMKKKATVVFVTHSIEEAVQLSSHVCVISPRPGKIHKIFEIDLPWPRNLEIKRNAKFINYVGEIQEIFHQYGVI